MDMKESTSDGRNSNLNYISASLCTTSGKTDSLSFEIMRSYEKIVCENKDVLVELAGY